MLFDKKKFLLYLSLDLSSRFSMFNHPEVTEEFVRMNEGDCEREKFCRDIAKPGYQIVEAIDSPRFIKSHFPLSLLPGILDSGCKVLCYLHSELNFHFLLWVFIQTRYVCWQIVYVARNPKDVAVSWYHLNRAVLTQGYIGDFHEFWEYFRNDLSTDFSFLFSLKMCEYSMYDFDWLIVEISEFWIFINLEFWKKRIQRIPRYQFTSQSLNFRGPEFFPWNSIFSRSIIHVYK